MPLNIAGSVLSPVLCITVFLFATVGAEDPYRFFNWNVTYGDIYPLGVRQQVCFQFRSDWFFFLFFLFWVSIFVIWVLLD